MQNSSLSIEPISPRTSGLPIPFELDSKKQTSFFEFWPGWIMYFPVVIQWLVLTVRYRSLTVPFIANPNLTLSGMVGVPKSELLGQANGICKDTILPWSVFRINDSDPTLQANIWIKDLSTKQIKLPFVCKPDIGCRGSGVKLIKTVNQLSKIIKQYPVETSLMCQRLSSYESEVGIFFVKYPHDKIGEIVSLTAKYLPKVTGDGKTKLKDLIKNDERAGQLIHLFEKRFKDSWELVPNNGEEVCLVFSASHSKGAVFRDATKYITPELTKKINEIMNGLPQFYYGRLDVKYSDLENLQKGKNLEIIEINAASSESTQIWDRNAKFSYAIRMLLWQYRTLFKLGSINRNKGYKPPSINKFIKHLKVERNLSKYYPNTD